MQLIVTSPFPKTCAERLWQNVSRAKGALTETQQLLAYYQLHFHKKVTILTIDGEPYATPKTFGGHPLVKWVCQRQSNGKWLMYYLFELYKGYIARFPDNKGYANIPNNLKTLNAELQGIELPDPYTIKFLNHAKCNLKGLDFTNEPNVFKAYDLFLRAQGD